MLLRYQLRLEDLNIFPTTSLRVYLDFLRANLAPGDWIRYGVLTLTIQARIHHTGFRGVH